MIDTSVLPAADVLLFRALKKTAVLVLLMLRIDPRPAGRDLVAGVLDISQKTAAEYLESLAYLGLATRTAYHGGYMLSTSGRQLALSIEEKLPTREQSPALAAAVTVSTGEEPPALAETVEDGGAIVENFSTVEKNRIYDSRKKDSSRDPLNISSTFFLSCGKEISTVEILEAVEELFGNAVVMRGIPEDVEARLALGWVAQAWADRARLRHPVGVIYNGLRKGETPRRRFVEDPLDGLPETFLKAIGIELEEEEISRDLTPAEETLTPALSQRERGEDASVHEVINGGFTAAKAWEAALGQLQYDMPKASFNTWVRDTRCVRYNDGELVIAASNGYARDWLSSRLSSTVTRLLTGILNQSVSIRFVVQDGKNV